MNTTEKMLLKRAATLMRDAAETIRLARMVGVEEGIFLEEEGASDIELVSDLCNCSIAIQALLS